MSSLLNSLSTSVNGLQSQSYAMANTSNNLANASTTGYKTTMTSFDDIVTTTATKRWTGTNGCSASTAFHNGAQGTIIGTATGTNLAINGNGYFVVAAGTLNSDGTVTFGRDAYYTRDGDFSRNASGYLQNSEGYYLMGYSVDPATGAVGTALTPVVISSALTNASIATSQLAYTANLDANASTGATSSSSPVSIYDSAGSKQTVSYAWTKTGDGAWSLTVTSPGGAYDPGTGLANDFTTTIGVTFDEHGKIASIDGTGSGYTVVGNTISFDVTYDGSQTQSISCDLSNMTQFDSSTSTQVADVSAFTQNGVAAGSYKGIEIDESGNIAVDYTNGQAQTYFEVALATFNNVNGLEAMSDNVYKETLASGVATYTAVGHNGAGTLKTSSLEASNVDIATEFTTMIQTQQVYSANSKVVSAVNSMMQTLIQLQSI